jgi:molybdenum cofactor biosynthesis enzyme MoaA
VDMFSELGIDKVRLTGGEPLLPQRPASWCRCWRITLASDLAMTTTAFS